MALCLSGNKCCNVDGYGDDGLDGIDDTIFQPDRMCRGGVIMISARVTMDMMKVPSDRGTGSGCCGNYTSVGD